MKSIILPLSAALLFACAVSADENLDALKREIEELKKRVTGLEEQNSKLKEQIAADRLIVRKELIVSDCRTAKRNLRRTGVAPVSIFKNSFAGQEIGCLKVRDRRDACPTPRKNPFPI